MIARLRPDEGLRFRAVRLASLHDAPEAFGSTYDETATRPAAVWERQLRDMPTFVAVRDGADVGVVRFFPPDELISMWVAPQGRGGGFGEALIRAVVAEARRCSAPSLKLQVKEANTPAIRLYERVGFVHAGREEGCCELRMQLAL